MDLRQGWLSTNDPGQLEPGVISRYLDLSAYTMVEKLVFLGPASPPKMPSSKRLEHWPIA